MSNLVFYSKFALCSENFVVTLLTIVSSFLSNRWLRAVLDEKSSQEYPVNAGVSQNSIFGPALFPLYTVDLSDDFIWKIAIYADDTTLY